MINKKKQNFHRLLDLNAIKLLFCIISVNQRILQMWLPIVSALVGSYLMDDNNY